MAIENYIHDLLYRYDCVILPGFGAFITRHQSARIVAETNELVPPQKAVFFNQQLSQNDGLLANHVMEAENISYKEAIGKIHQYSADLRTALKQNNQMELAGLGSFTMTQEKKIQFEPLANKNFLKEAFGLSSYVAKPVLRASEESVVSMPETSQVQQTRRKTTPWLRYAAIGIIGLGLGGYTGMNFYSDQIAQHNLAEQQKAEAQLGRQIQQATFIIENPLPAITLNVDRQSGKYHIVAGAFRQAENAQKRVDELKTEGYKARLIGTNKYGLHQVVYSSYETRREALQALREVKNTSNPSAWLLVEEL